jgi:outer membrane biosynthesis protein TonB
MKKTLWQKILQHPEVHAFFQDRENRILTLAVLISLGIHSVLLIMLSFQTVSLKKKIQKKIEVVYQAAPKLKKEAVVTRDIEAIKDRIWAPKPKSVSKKDDSLAAFSPKLGKSTAKMEIPKGDQPKAEMQKKLPLKMSSPETKRHVSVPLLDSEKISNPKYINYHDRIRTKIRNRAYMYVDNPAFANGEVYLTFVVASNGQVTAVKVIEEKTKANDYLRNVGLQSI